jgi:alginate O-acetyltransferase complex protein AlgI
VLFQTVDFLVLMSAVLLGIILIRSHTWRLVLLLVASWVFYMWWKPVFMLLLLFTTLNDYFLGLAIGHATSRRGRAFWLTISCATNLGVLAVFKYCDFFLDSVKVLCALAGWHPVFPAVQILLPVGISFYTFHSMGYNIDVFRGHNQPERSFLRFAIYVAFFPQLVAGPILRSTQFLPQLRRPFILSAGALRSGANLFLVGLVKKVLIADNVSPLADGVFDHPHGLPSTAIVLATLAFGIQIYCDFSGYTDMARGASRMLGLDIIPNFNYPYFSRSITDFWRRWHMSLSSWLRDYLYIPLGGNLHGTISTYRNLLITMGLGGLWHGASWNFVAWGVYQGLLLAIERAFGIGGPHARSNHPDNPPSARVPRRYLRLLGFVASWLVCQYLVFLGWVMFRAHNAADLGYCVWKYVAFDFRLSLTGLGLGYLNPFRVGAVIVSFCVVHACSYRCGGLASALDRAPRWVQWVTYVLAVYVLVWLWPARQAAFIYFQF